MIIEGTASSVTSTFVRSDVRERKKLKRAVQVTAKTGSNTTPNRGTWAAFSSKSTAAGVSPQPEWLHSAEAEALTSALDSATWIIDDGSSKGDTITAGQSSDVESTLFRTDDTLSDMTEVSDFFVEVSRTLKHLLRFAKVSHEGNLYCLGRKFS
ncbi:hypothetical protein BC830DRAFT_942531 [Chytriomyces sp. MP71]|nr:hypothetical protein BC830DRAFT_942531 [Chytriomyces sp. MP71]